MPSASEAAEKPCPTTHRKRSGLSRWARERAAALRTTEEADLVRLPGAATKLNAWAMMRASSSGSGGT